MNKYLKILIVAVLLSHLVSPVLAGSVTGAVLQEEIVLRSSDAGGLTFEINLPLADLLQEQVNTPEGVYTRLTLPGWPRISQAGAPELPFFAQVIGAPFGAEIEVRATPGLAQVIELETPLLPGERQEILWEAPGVTPGPPQVQQVITVIEADASIYQADLPFPGELVEVANDDILRQQRLVSIAAYPLQYLPLSNQVLVYESLLIEIRFTGGSTQGLRSIKNESAVYEGFFQQNLLNYDQAKSWRTDSSPLAREQSATTLQGTSQSSAPWAPPNPGWRIQVQQKDGEAGEAGFYHLTAAEMAAAGVPVETLDPATLQMFHLGAEIAIQVNADQSIVFYGEKVDSKYTADNVYWLTYGKEDGLRIGTRDGGPNAAPKAESFNTTLHLEQNLIYTTRGQGEFEHFFWDWASWMEDPSKIWSTTFNLSNRHDENEDVLLRVLLMGHSQDEDVNPDHHAVISLNGEVLPDDIRWDGWAFKTAEITLPAAKILSGDNTLKVEASADTGASRGTFMIDWVQFEYASTFTAAADSLAFSYQTSGERQFEVTSFTSTDVTVFDVTQPEAPEQIVNINVQGTAPSFSATFEDNISAPTFYWTGTTAAYRAVKNIVADVPSDLQSDLHQADYLLISHGDFLTQAAVLVDHRQSQGLTTQLIDVQDIYDEFGFGIVDPLAIQNFLAYACKNWQAPAPTYVLLVGDGHYDPKNHLGYGRTSYIPAFLANVDSIIDETAVDNRYVSFQGKSALPQMMLGRLSVNTPGEAEAFIAKIIAYETNPLAGDWRRQVLAVADYDPHPSNNFAQTLEALLGNLLPAEPYGFDPVYWKITHTDVGEARTAIQNGFDQGKLIINYNGHGGYNVWGRQENEFLFYSADIAHLPQQEKLPVILSMTCSDGYFISPRPLNLGFEALAERLTRVEGKGAVASWSPTGWGTNSAHERLNYGFLESVFVNNKTILGEAIMNGQQALFATGRNLDLLDTYMLFGDPATRLALSLTAVNDFYQVDELGVLNVPSASGVLQNDTNPDNLPLTAELVDDAHYGDLSLNPDGSFVYSPGEGFTGTDSFTYLISADGEVSNTATVTIDVYPVHRPVAHPQELYTFINKSLNIVLTAEEGGLSLMRSASQYSNGGRSDPEFTFRIVEGPEHGELTGVEGAAERLYTPEPGYVGPDYFTFVANNGGYDSLEAAVQIIVLSEGFEFFLPLILH